MEDGLAIVTFACNASALPHFVREELVLLLLFLSSGGSTEQIRPLIRIAMKLDCLEWVEVPGP